ncbi:S9 family peptidase [Pectobacterium cacticida]|uniref:S9 family peptidase n=1 Tax=Pectobacterium cacticida TaxID=69221 RepID=UPI00398815F5
MNILWFIAANTLLVTFASMARDLPQPPRAEIKSELVVTHGDTRRDNYRWLRDDTRKDKRVMAYLNAENQYAEAVSQRWRLLTDTLYTEMRARQADDKYSPPYQNNGMVYQYTFPKQANFPILMRKKAHGKEWETILDVNARSKEQHYYRLSHYAVSEDNRYVAVAEDLIGDGQNRISILDTRERRWLNDSVGVTSGEVVFSRDSHSFFYVRNHPQTLTPYQVMRHEIGAQTPDHVVYTEQDDSLYTGLSRSASREYLIITLSGNETSEARVLALGDPTATPQLIRPRIKGQEYYVDHGNGQFYIRSNAWDKRFGIYAVRQIAEPWETVVAPNNHDEIENFILFDDWLVLVRRIDGKTHFSRLAFADARWETLELPDQSYMARIGNNIDSHASSFRFIYSTLDKPVGYYQWDLRANRVTLEHQKTVPGVDLNQYASEFITVASRDGQMIPVSLVYRKDTFRPGENPLLVYGYGAYGISLDAAFSAPRVSLLDRGFVFALAHVRGGGEKGIDWYLNGKKAYKQNSFNDVIDVTHGLIRLGYGSENRVYGMGGSAGGLLMAAVVNQAPSLFKAVVLQVPFVDVLNTMLDASLPLTQQEYDEWGNPTDPEFYRLIKAYSPYDNISAQVYPDMLVTAGLHDSRVPYWEPAKFVAKLRALNQGKQPLVLLTTDMHAGHGGKSGRYSRLKDSARAFSFLLFIDQEKQGVIH